MAFGGSFKGKKSEGNSSKGIRLPGVLLDEIKGKHENDRDEVDDHYSLNNNSGKKSKRKAAPAVSRKDKRREERTAKKQKKTGSAPQQTKHKQVKNKSVESDDEESDDASDVMKQLAKLKSMKNGKNNISTSGDLKIVKASELDLDEDFDDDDLDLDEDDFEDFEDFDEDNEEEDNQTSQSAEDTMAALKALKEKKNKKTAEPQTAEDTMAALKALKEKKNKKTAEPQTAEDTMAALKALKEKKNKKTAEPQTAEDTMAALKALKEKKNKKTAEPQTAQDALAALKALKDKKKADKVAEKAKKSKKKEELLDIDPFEYNSMRRDELDIAHYAKMLGLKGKQRHKLPETADEDGLNDILEGLDLDYGFSDDERKSKYAEAKESELESEPESEGQDEDTKLPFSSDDELDSDDFDDDFSEGDMEGLEDDEDSDSADDAEGGDEANGNDESDSEDGSEDDSEEEAKPQKENPYVAPVSADSTGKYIPPSVRRRMMQESGAGAEQSEEMIKLRRQAKGLFNRLSESNIGSILSELEQLYLRNARGNVTQVIVSILIESTAIPGNLLESFLILHAALATSLYRTMGIEFGAALIQSLVENFDKYFLSESTQKEASNLLSLLSELYTFQLISCNLMYDFIRLFLDDINERKTEYLLKIVRNSGAQLRTDDPAALRDIITLLQVSVTKVGQDQINTRTKFLIESIHALKNNRQKNTSEINNSAVIRMKKFLGGIVGRTNEPIRVSLADIREVETRGKWWLVGAAWRNHSADGSNGDDIKQEDADFAAINDILDTAEPNWVELAREQRMNTDIRRAVFIAIMGSEDYLNACERLQKLRLKRVQEREIPRVILRCCGNEKVYNPFYALVASKLCEQQHSLKMTLQFCLWDYFHELEGDEDSEEDSDKDDFEDLMNEKEDEDEETKLRKILNLSRFYASIVSDGSMSLAIFKNVNFLTAKTELRLFMEFFFVTFLQNVAKKAERANGPRPKGSSKMFEVKRDDKIIIQILNKCRENPTLLRGIQYFLQTYVLISDNVEKPKEKERIKWAVDLICDVVDEFLMSA